MQMSPHRRPVDLFLNHPPDKTSDWQFMRGKTKCSSGARNLEEVSGLLEEESDCYGDNDDQNDEDYEEIGLVTDIDIDEGKITV